MGEIAIEQKVVKEAKKLGAIGLKLTSPGNTGVPDRMFLIPGGKPLFIEFKKPGEELSAKQEYWVMVFKALDYQIEVHEDAGQAIQAIRKALDTAYLPTESA